MWAARSRRTHQRNGLAHVPGRDVPDVLREHGNFSVSSWSASAQQPFGCGFQGCAAADGVGLKSVPVFSIACMITANFRANATAARLKPSRFLNARVLRDNQNHVRCVNQASLTLESFIHRKLHPAIMMSGRQTAVKPSPSGSRRWRLRA
jgi:hypothetical protein